jgi:hypothetical protein
MRDTRSEAGDSWPVRRATLELVRHYCGLCFVRGHAARTAFNQGVKPDALAHDEATEALWAEQALVAAEGKQVDTPVISMVIMLTPVYRG